MTLRRAVLGLIAGLLFAAVPFANADPVPAHLASFVATLYQDLERDVAQLEPGSRREDLEAVLDVMRRAGVHRWASSPVRLKTAAEEIDERRHRIQLDGGDHFTIEWKPQTNDFELRVNRASGTESETIVTSKSEVEIDPADGSMRARLDPERKTVKVLSRDRLDEVRGSILGRWEDSEGHVFEISAASESDGEIAPSPAELEERIKTLRDELRRLEDAKEFIWENVETREMVRQRRFRKLKPPFQYKGERLIVADAAERIADLEKRIAELEAERTRIARLSDSDPVDFEEVRSSPAARPITIRFTQPDGHSYSWAEAYFDGRRIAARRTYSDVREFAVDLPRDVKGQLIASWSPPMWLGMHATLDARTGSIYLTGSRWSLHVSYKAEPLGGNTVNAIHTPYPVSLRFDREADEEETIRIVRIRDGAYVPLDGPLSFGVPFFVEARVEEGDDRSTVTVTIGGGAERPVTLGRVEGDPRILRSQMLYLIWNEGDEKD